MRMEDRKKKHSEMLAAAVIGLAAVLFAAGILMVLFWCDYVEKRECCM